VPAMSPPVFVVDPNLVVSGLITVLIDGPVASVLDSDPFRVAFRSAAIVCCLKIRHQELR